MIRIRGRRLGCGTRRWSGEGGGWVEDQFVTSGIVKAGWRDGCVDDWIVEVMVWGVVIGWGTVPAPRSGREVGDVNF